MRLLFIVLILISALRASAEDVSGRRMVWAHYVPWYTPDNASQIAKRFHSYPQTEVDVAPFRAEIERALAQGIDGFFNDMVAHRGGATSYWDLRPFLRAAEGTPFLFGICLDAKTTVEQQVKELVKMLSTYGNHPNYPKWGNRYVVDTYTFLRWTPDEWRAIRKGCEDAGYPIYVIANVETGFLAFDADKLKPYVGTFERAYHFAHYGMDRGRFKSIERETEECAKFCEANGAVYMPCVWPGYYGAWMAGFNSYYQPFLGFDMAQRRFDTWRLVKNADWLHITTYNDHGETAMMPRRHVTGNKAIVKAMSDEFKGIEPSQRVDVQFAYSREVMPGTMLRFEAMRLPSANKGAVAVSGVLRDAAGKVVCRLDEKKFTADGWNRLEWLVSTTKISATPYLAPEFTVREWKTCRIVRPPKVFLVTGWLENPVTVKASVDDYAVISNRLGVCWSNGVLRARCAFIADVKVRRAVLFRNDRPLTTFQPDAGKILNVYFSGGNDVVLKTGNAKVIQAVKSFEQNDTRDFTWDEKHIISRRTPGWMLMSARIEANGTDELLFSSSGQSVKFMPSELVEKGSVSVGSGKVWMDADGTTYDLPSLDVERGGYTAEVWTKKPDPNDAYWVEFELADGRIAESDVLYPFVVSTESIEINVVETPVTLDRTSGASGAPDTVEFFTPKSEWPVKETRVVKAKVSPQSIRHRVFAKGEKIPHRCWPMGSFRMSCLFVPEQCDGKERLIAGKIGWNEGPELRLRADGRLEADFCGGDDRGVSPRFSYKVASKVPLPRGKKVRIVLVNDSRAFRMMLDGELQGECPIPPLRAYGNVSPVIGDGINGENPSVGILHDLEFSGNPFAPLETERPAPKPICTNGILPSDILPFAKNTSRGQEFSVSVEGCPIETIAVPTGDPVLGYSYAMFVSDGPRRVTVTSRMHDLRRAQILPESKGGRPIMATKDELSFELVPSCTVVIELDGRGHSLVVSANRYAEEPPKGPGARYVTMTARHHDGFSLWPSRADDGYNISNTPFGRDIIGEMAEACAKNGLQLNLYYSLLDWHRKDYPTGIKRKARSTLKDRREDYGSYKRFMIAQVAELLDAYRPGCIWFDGEWDHDPTWHDAPPDLQPMDWGFDEIYDLIHRGNIPFS